MDDVVFSIDTLTKLLDAFEQCYAEKHGVTKAEEVKKEIWSMVNVLILAVSFGGDINRSETGEEH